MSKANGISRRSFIKYGATTAAVLGVAGLVGCGSSTASSGATSAASAIQTASQVTDMYGDVVELPGKIDTIADFWHAHNQVILLLGAADKIKVTTTNVQAIKWFAKVCPSIMNAAALVDGTNVNIEEVLKIAPDVVFSSSKDQIKTARDNGLTTVGVMFQDFDGLREDISLTAEVLGGDAPSRAQDYLDYLDGNIDYVNQKMSGASDTGKVSVLHIVNKSSLTKVDGTDCIIDEWIKMAGGVNAIQKSGNMIDVTMEDIVAADPDVIIIGSNGANDAVKTILSDSAWSGIKAVKNQAVYANPQGTFPWDRYSSEEALQVLWVAQKLNPKVFSDLDMAAKTQEFYKKFYGYDLSEADANLILASKDPTD